MFMVKSILLTGLLSIGVFLASCDKDKDNQELSAESKLLGKWSFKSYVYWDGTQSQTHTYPPGQYLQFETGGKLTAKVDNAITYSAWQLLDEGKTLFIQDNGTLDVPENGYEIKTLTETSLVLFGNEANAPAAEGTTVYLEK